MADRLSLQALLEELLGSRNVYYQPPASRNLSYPAIVYNKAGIDSRKASDSVYTKSRSYELVVIDPKPDNPVIDKLLELPYCSFSRHYTSDNLNHDALKLYY